MKIGISSDSSSVKYGENTYLKLREYGFDAIDFSLADTESKYYTLPSMESDALLLKEKKMCKEAGILLNQVHGPWRWPPRDFELADRLERLEKMKKSIQMTSVLGVKYWVVHPIMPFGIEDIGTGNEAETRRLNLEFMRELLPVAIENDVIICLENMPMPKFSLGSPEQILNFVKEINHENFKICLDTGHVNVYDDLNLYDETKRLGEYIKCLHIHDNKYGIDMHLFPKFGTADFDNFAKALREIGYDGVFNIEIAPPSKLSDEAFGDACRLMVAIAEEIINT